ncbi:D-alanine--D-alanine ligase [Gilvibacter sp.]|uniref:D-alanine--D-alanine ligase n=1 Tax=Gilvibacter sp. TaxID=2729997 RepID=UPI003F4A0C80
MKPVKVAVIMGGYSSEHSISVESGATVVKHLQKADYEVFAVHIERDHWYYLDAENNKYIVDRGDFSFMADGVKVIPDAIFNVIHGTPGEDGLMQSYLELIGIPQTSCNFYQAALSFNKRDCLAVLKQFGVKCAQSYYLNKETEVPLEEIVKAVGFPCFVKPNRAGSSYGISKVYDMEALQPAIDKAFEEDHQILIETALVGTEVSIGAYDHDGRVQVLLPTEIVSENDFFDYEAKYLGKSDEITPARISPEETARAQAETARIYGLLEMSGLVRCDFILQDGEPYFLEINTNPGLSEASIIPKQAEAANIPLSQLFAQLVQNVLPQK